MRTLLALIVLSLALASNAGAQFVDDQGPDSSRLGPPKTVHLNVGVIIKATGSPLINTTILTPIPMDWPEQMVTKIGEESSSHVQSIEFEEVTATAKRMVIRIPRMGPNETACAMVTFEVRRRAILAPAATDDYVAPKRKSRELRPFLDASPYIETKRSQIRKVAREVVADVDGDWRKVEAIYDWVRANVKYTRGPIKGAFAALKDGTGDCEELSSLIIAMCRINNIPARTVWVPDHCYPEFYLTDKDGNGTWFPCQAAGTRAFGSIPEYRPILQKGDNFRVPELRELQRYVAEHVQIEDVPGGNKPEVSFIRDVISIPATRR